MTCRGCFSISDFAPRARNPALFAKEVYSYGPRHFKIEMPWDGHSNSMDGRQRGAGRLLPAVNDECSVSQYSALVRRKKGRVTQLFGQKNY